MRRANDKKIYNRNAQEPPFINERIKCLIDKLWFRLPFDKTAHIARFAKIHFESFPLQWGTTSGFLSADVQYRGEFLITGCDHNILPAVEYQYPDDLSRRDEIDAQLLLGARQVGREVALPQNATRLIGRFASLKQQAGVQKSAVVQMRNWGR